MTEIFNIDRIKESDQLREKKINALNRAKELLQGIDEDINIKALERGLWNIIREYKLSCQREDVTLRRVSEKYPDFEENWHEKIVSATDYKEIKEISNIVQKALVTFSGSLTWELKQMKEKTKELWSREDYQGGDISKFDAKFPLNVNNGNWANRTARKILRWILLMREDEKGTKQIFDEAFKNVMDNLHGAKFHLNRFGKVEITDVYGQNWNVAGFKWWMEHNVIGSPNLFNSYLPATGQTRASLLRKLEEVIKNGEANATSSSDSGNDNVKGESESNIKGESQDQSSNQNQGSEEDNTPLISEENIKPESSQEEELVKVKREVMKSYWEECNKEPRVKNEELPSETRDLISQIAKTKDIQHLLFIQSMFVSDFNIIRSRRLRDAEIKEATQKFQNGQVDNNDFMNAFTKMNDSLGEEDNEENLQELRKVMVQNDPEQFFSSFVQWVEEEEKKLEEIKRELAEEKETISESEWDVEEKQFLKGQIADQQQREIIAERIEAKIKVKKESWSFKKWLKEWVRWLKTKARLLRKSNKVGFEKQAAQIKQEVKNMENNSNRYVQQAFQDNKNHVNNLLAELDTISQGNQTVAPNEKGFFRPEVVIPVSLSAVVLAIAVAVVIRKRKLAKAKK